MQTPDRFSPLVVSSRKSHCRAPSALTERFLPLRTMTDGEMFVVEDRAEDSGLLLQNYGRFTRLYCMNGGFHLQILPDGTVQGQRDDGDVHIVLKLKAVDRGVVVIQGTAAERYLAMSDEGRLYASPTVTDECYFLEKLEENHYNTYKPQKYQERNCFGYATPARKGQEPQLSQTRGCCFIFEAVLHCCHSELLSCTVVALFHVAIV